MRIGGPLPRAEQVNLASHVGTGIRQALVSDHLLWSDHAGGIWVEDQSQRVHRRGPRGASHSSHSSSISVGIWVTWCHESHPFCISESRPDRAPMHLWRQSFDKKCAYVGIRSNPDGRKRSRLEASRPRDRRRLLYEHFPRRTLFPPC